MFKKVLIALTAAATLTGATFTAAAPAQAHYVWGYGYHHNYYHHHYNTYTSYYAPSECAWVWKNVKVWGEHGPYWVQKKVQVCD